MVGDREDQVLVVADNLARTAGANTCWRWSTGAKGIVTAAFILR
jgi:hypothetical protein